MLGTKCICLTRIQEMFPRESKKRRTQSQILKRYFFSFDKDASFFCVLPSCARLKVEGFRRSPKNIPMFVAVHVTQFSMFAWSLNSFHKMPPAILPNLLLAKPAACRAVIGRVGAALRIKTSGFPPSPQSSGAAPPTSMHITWAGRTATVEAPESAVGTVSSCHFSAVTAQLA